MRRASLVLLVLAALVAVPTARMLSRAAGSRADREQAWPVNPEEDRRSRSLDTDLTDTRAREAERRRVATRLVRGELDLDQAAGQFAALGAAGPDRVGLMRRRYPAAAEDELAYWLVLWFTRGVTEEPADQVAAAQVRIFAAFRERFPNGPDPAADPHLRPAGLAQATAR